jgi:hypothetical protein
MVLSSVGLYLESDCSGNPEAIVGVNYRPILSSELQIVTAEPLVPDPSLFEAEIPIEKLKYKSPGSDKIPVELIQAGGKTLLSAIHIVVHSIWNNCLISGSCVLLYHFPKKGKKSR